MHKKIVNRAVLERGFSLLELTVGLTIGLIVVVAATGSLVHAQSVARGAAEATRLQQEAALAFQLIGRFVQASGSVGLTPTSTDSVALAPRASGMGLGSDGERLQGDSPTAFRTTQTAGPNGVAVDCMGVTQPQATTLVTVFDWSQGRVRCGQPDAPMYPFLDRVEQMVVHYAVRNPATQRLQYREFASDMVWTHVVAMRICLVLTSTGAMPEYSQVFRDAGALRYDDCRGNDIANAIRTDSRMRKKYTHVFTIRQGHV